MISRAGIQYIGEPGITEACKQAIIRLIQSDTRIVQAKILSCVTSHHTAHAFLLETESKETVAVKSGFASGYGGEGPKGLSFVLSLLDLHKVEIEEFDVKPALMRRLDESALTTADLDSLDRMRPVRPVRWFEYQSAFPYPRPWEDFPLSIPYAVIDFRVADLALDFFDGPDQCLMTGYRRLESFVRQKAQINEHGERLFSKAFLGDDPRLVWDDVSPSEQVGRGQLFTGAFKCLRNRRAHHEKPDGVEDMLREFLMLNQLFVMENACRLRKAGSSESAS